MRSRLTIDSIYHVYTQGQQLQEMADTAVGLWEQQLDTVEPAKRRDKRNKMLELAKAMPHPHFPAFMQAVATTAEARATRKKSPDGRLPPVPVPAVVQRETEMQRLTRNLDVQGIILGGILDVLALDTPEQERTWLHAQTLLTERMQQAGLTEQCNTLLASFVKEGWDLKVFKQCVDWLNVGALGGLMAQVFAHLGKTWAQVAEDEKAGRMRQPLSVAQAADLYPARVMLRILGVAGLRDLAQVPPESRLEDALAARLKDFIKPLSDGIANHHAANTLHALFDLYVKKGEKAFDPSPFTGVQKQAARMYCRVVAFVQKQEQAWTQAARDCMQAEAIARVDRRLKKNPQDASRWLDRARALNDYRNDTRGALEALDHVPNDKRDGAYVRERAIVLGKMGRLTDVISTLNAALATPAWDDRQSLAKLFCLRAEARLHDKDVLSAWADARRATVVDPSTPRLMELSKRVLEGMEKQEESTWLEALREPAEQLTFRIELARARSNLLHARWEEACGILKSEHPRSPAAATLAKQVAELAQELAKFSSEAEAHPDAGLPGGLNADALAGLPPDITPEELAELLRQHGLDPEQAGGLQTIDEGSDSDDGSDDGAPQVGVRRAPSGRA